MKFNNQKLNISSSSPDKFSYFLAAILTGCTDTSMPATFSTVTTSPFPIYGDIPSDSKQFFMISVMQYFLTGQSF